MEVLASEDRLFLKYLGLLGMQKETPGLKYLKQILAAQLSRIPFENISKLLYKKRRNLNRMPDFESYLEGMETYGFGGTCYTINFYLNQLLDWLGFRVRLCGADMKDPDVHLVNVVDLGGREFLVDAGYAAPFMEPLPLDLSEDHAVQMGSDRYVLKPRTGSSASSIEFYRSGKLTHGYRINPKARAIQEFTKVIEESFAASSTFMNALLLTRLDGNHFIRIDNMTFMESHGNVSKRKSIGSFEELANTIHDRFRIPKPIIAESLDGLEMRTNG